jgi:hypothetical protein
LTQREKSLAPINASRYGGEVDKELSGMSKAGARKARPAEMNEPKKGAVMNETKKAQELFAQGSGKVVEAMTLWAEANQRFLRELAELSAATTKEGVRLYAELQQSGIEALRDAQATALQWQSTWQEAPRDPLAWCQRAVTDTVENTQKWFRILEGNAQAVTRTAERMQTTAEQAGKGMQASLSDAVTRMKDVYAA